MIRTLYKLTDGDGCSGHEHNKMQWGPGVTHKVKASKDAALCTGAWIHAYESPLLAVLMAPIHVSYDKLLLWRAQGFGAFKSDGTKCGVSKLKTTRKMAIPKVTTAQRVRFAILCAKEVYKEPSWVAWADGWLSGKDRSAAAAKDAASAATAADAAYAAAAAYAAYAADAAAAAYAADAANAKPGLDLVAIAKRAIKEEPE